MKVVWVVFLNVLGVFNTIVLGERKPKASIPWLPSTAIFPLRNMNSTPFVVFGSEVVEYSQNHLHDLHHEELFDNVPREVIRHKLIKLPLELPREVVGEMIVFKLFNDAVVQGRTTSISQHNGNCTTWSGDARFTSMGENVVTGLDFQDGSFTLTCMKDSCVAAFHLHSTNQEFSITPAGLPLTESGDGIYAISEFRLSPERRSASSIRDLIRGKLHTPSVNMKTSNLRTQTRERNMTTLGDLSMLLLNEGDLFLDILAVYTPQALQGHAGGSHTAMQTLIYFANDQANTILANSAVRIRYRIIGFYYPATFIEPTGPTAFTDLLNWLTYGDGVFEAVRDLRVQLGADEVVMVVNANQYCGAAWTNIELNRDFAYAVYNGGCVNGRVWGHEIGHNLGCFHDRFADATDSLQYPDYLGFGSCWEDVSKSDCTCYSSIMVYRCNTSPNRCTNCIMRDFYANYQVMNAGNPTGTTTASCGLWIDQNRAIISSFYPTTQSGGMILFISPNLVIASTCTRITISGWQFSLQPDGNDITSVSFAGYSTTILSRSSNTITVLTRPIANLRQAITGDAKIETRTGRVTTFVNGFTFVSNTYEDFEDFSQNRLPTGIWQENGTLPWSYQVINQQLGLFKDSGSRDTEDFYVSLIWSSKYVYQPDTGGCRQYAQRLAFNYWIYSRFPACYHQFTVAIQQEFSMQWQIIWSENGRLLGNNNPWLFFRQELPSDTTGIRIFADTTLVNNCRYWSPVYIANISTTLIAQCDTDRACALSDPSSSPARVPTRSPTSASPSRVPTRSPTSASPSRVPTRSPTSASTSRVPTRSPTSASPSRVPTRSPTSASPSRVPTRSPTSASPSRVPSRVPTRSIATFTPTSSSTICYCYPINSSATVSQF